MRRLVFVVDDCSEGGFLAMAVGESIFTCASSLEHLKSNVRDAVECHLDESEAAVCDIILQLPNGEEVQL